MLEKLIVIFWVNLAIDRDMSIGVSQIKISTAKKLFPEKDERFIARKLLNDSFNIEVCAHLLNFYYENIEDGGQLLKLVKFYTTGDINSQNSVAINTYCYLLEWIKTNELLTKTGSVENEVFL